MECKEIIGAEIRSDFEAVLITLRDGRCASIDLREKYIYLDVFLYTFDRFGEYFQSSYKDLNTVIEILKNPKKIIDWGTQKYLTNEEYRKECDKEKKELGYNY